MPHPSIFRRRPPPAAAGAAALAALGALALFWSCGRGDGDEARAPRAIRAHTRIISGVAHAEPAQRGAERYCAQCHGASLAGGAAGEPSCYTCHGKTWLDGPDLAGVSLAPSDHTVVNGRYAHHPALAAPAGACDACHGTALEGAAPRTPGCLLCHEAKW